MNASKFFISTAAAVAVVGAIGLAYAQTSPSTDGSTTAPGPGAVTTTTDPSVTTTPECHDDNAERDDDDHAAAVEFERAVASRDHHAEHDVGRRSVDAQYADGRRRQQQHRTLEQPHDRRRQHAHRRQRRVDRASGPGDRN